jgi:hypothetical protein
MEYKKLVFDAYKFLELNSQHNLQFKKRNIALNSFLICS